MEHTERKEHTKPVGKCGARVREGFLEEAGM